MSTPEVTIVVVAFNIPRELPRTLYSLSTNYQQKIIDHEYEVIVVDNGSQPPVDSKIFENLKGNFRLLRIDHASPSPAAAANLGVAAARGQTVGVMIDGARIASPGLLYFARHGCSLHSHAVVGALGWYLGCDYQRQSMQAGYDQQQEDALLASIDWKRDGYALYDISAMDESSVDGWFAPFGELNAIFMRQERWVSLAGYDERFDLPGGGLVNLDICKRALEAPQACPVILLGEATFHQFHGGTATNTLPKKAIDDWNLWNAQYCAIRGVEYELPRLAQPPIYLGVLPSQMRQHFLRALAIPVHAHQPHPLGSGFALSHWAMPRTEPGQDAALLAVWRILLREVAANRFATAAAVCRMVRAQRPDCPAVLRVLSLVGPWLPFGGEPADAGAAFHATLADVQAIFAGVPTVATARSTAMKSFGAPVSQHMQSVSAECRLSIPSLGSSVFAFPPASLIEPGHLTHPAPWAGHIPFASWLLSVQQPGTFVELGTYSGISYMAFCQAVVAQQLPTRAWAVDTWQGDAHAGAYDDTIYNNLRSVHDPLYSGFSSLLRMTFDEALAHFSDGSVDLLHIDGLHTYEAVRHDFESWLPKLSGRAVVLFHDTDVYRADFGVFRLWDELSARYPSFRFHHSNGLGVLLVGADQPDALLSLATDPQTQHLARRAFSQLGARLERQAEILALRLQLSDAEQREAFLQQAGDKRHQWIEHLDARVLDLERRHAHATDAVANLNSALAERDASIDQLNRVLTERDASIDQLNRVLVERDASLDQLNRVLADRSTALTLAQRQIDEFLVSRSWRITKGLRTAGAWARRLRSNPGVDAAWRVTRRARNALRYIARGEWGGLWRRALSLRQEALVEQRLQAPAFSGRRCGVLATPHTQYVAHALVHALRRAGLEADIVAEASSGHYPLDLYFVVCPQMFKRLPPGEKRIAFQMEQSVSSRWFTPEYLRTLENSLAVLDYAQTNLQFLEGRGIAYPHTFLVPVGGFAGYGDYLRNNNLQPQGLDAPCDVLFYGDANAPRRQQLLAAIGERYQLRIVGNLFGPELHRAMASARVIVNLHYYEGALLETTRVYECLSLGLPVVSETSADQAEHAALEGAVRFVPVGDVPALLQAIGEVLGASPQESAAAQTAREAAVTASQARFEFMLYRMLLARRWLDYPQFQALTGTTPLPGKCLALSLPETTARRAMFISHQAPGVQVFDGLRYSPGWTGCALSYKYLAQQALAAQWPQLEVMEDDVLFLSDYAEHKAVVDAYLAQHSGQWDVFVGLVAIMHPDTRVLSVERQGGLVFVTIDRMMSMVHNTYAPTALRLLAQWDETHADPETNTIDRYLQTQHQLRVVTTLPFLVGHHEELHSSLWGIQNSHYAEIIATAQAELEAKVREFEQNALRHGGV